MALVETIFYKSSEFVIDKLLGWGYNKIIENKSDKYTQELYEIITKATTKYEKQYPIQETDRIPFYQSQTLLGIFLEFRFTKKLDFEKVKKEIEADSRIIPPSKTELTLFFNFFDDEVALSSNIKALNISDNFKEEIFNISEELGSLKNLIFDKVDELKASITSKNISSELKTEWNHQLDEILDNLKKFKAYTALERLETLEKRINESDIKDNKLFARLYSLKSDCVMQIGDNTKYDLWQLLINIYKLEPTNQHYKSNAALAYVFLSEQDKAEKLSNELIETDEFSIVGWAVRCYLTKSDFREVLGQVPVSVRTKIFFKAQVSRWLISAHLITNPIEIKELGLELNIDFNAKLELSHQNIHFQQLIAGVLLAIFFGEYSSVSAELDYVKASQNKSFLHALRILRESNNCLKGTEVEDNYLDYKFNLHCCEYIVSKRHSEIAEMELAYQKMTTKDFEVVLRMF